MDVKALTTELSVAPQTVSADMSAVAQAGIDLEGVVRRIVNGGTTPVEVPGAAHEGVILGGIPKWFIDGTRPAALAWYRKERVLPPLYWQTMPTGREWMAQPEMTT